MTNTIGIIGAGSIVEGYYLTALKQLGYSDILLYDVNETRAGHVAAQSGVKAAGIAAIKEKAGSIFIATPPHTHVDLVKSILSPGKNIICEKPFVLTHADAVLLNDAAQQASARLQVGHIRRMFPGIQLAQKYISQNAGRLGKLQQVHLHEGARFNYKSQSGYVKNHPQGGVLADTGSHTLDCMLYVTGLDQQQLHITVQTSERDRPEPSHEVSCMFEINSVPVYLRLSRYQALSNRMRLQYEGAVIDVPLGIKPSIRVSDAQGSTVFSAADSCISYFSQAFKEEFRVMLQTSSDTFAANRFINLSRLLETLYSA